jgi:hypothetical protein
MYVCVSVCVIDAHDAGPQKFLLGVHMRVYACMRVCVCPDRYKSIWGGEEAGCTVHNVHLFACVCILACVRYVVACLAHCVHVRSASHISPRQEMTRQKYAHTHAHTHSHVCSGACG